MRRHRYRITPGKKHRDSTALLRLRISWAGNRIDYAPGIAVDLSKWLPDAMRVKPNSTHTKDKVPATYINRVLQQHEDAVERLFASYEIDGITPTPEKLRQDLDLELGRSTEVTETFTAVAKAMGNDVGRSRQWTASGYDKLSALIKKVEGYSTDTTISQITEEWLSGWVTYLSLDCKLNNSTVIGYVKRIQAVLRYSDRHGYPCDRGALDYRPGLKTVDKQIIFLEWDELMTVLNAELPYPYLEKARDLFCISSFTGLRYSDLQKLTPADITDDCITIVTQKTTDTLHIELNDYSRALLAKYGNRPPQLSNQKYNNYIKEVGLHCGITTPIKTVRIRAGKREEKTYPKWQLLTTHAGRRTFISNALMMGIPVETVMKWTGHKNYEAMKPYIAIADRFKKSMMDRFNSKTGYFWGMVKENADE